MRHQGVGSPARPGGSPRVLLVPNCLRGVLPAEQVCAGLAAGVRDALPAAEIRSVPAADGGDGSLRCWARLRSAQLCRVRVPNPLGVPVVAEVGLSVDGTAFVEMAAASGLRTLRGQLSDPLLATTHGTGELIRWCQRRGAHTVLVGAGGSATLDMGAGALHALGARFVDRAGRTLPAVPRELARVARADLSAARRTLAACQVRVLADVRTPLRRNSERFGAQKGVTTTQRPIFARLLQRLTTVLGGPDRLDSPWYGAGGGLPAGLAALAAESVSGSEYLLRMLDFDWLLAETDLVITAEGRVDEGSREGKLPFVVAQRAAEHGVPCLLIAGEHRLSADRLPPTTTPVTLAPLTPSERPAQSMAALRRAAAASLRSTIADRVGVADAR